MRIARGLNVEEPADGCVRIVAHDWPMSLWVGAPLLAAGLALAAWALPSRQWIELGGGALFAAVGATSVGLWMARQRDVELLAALDGVSISGTTGAGAFRRAIAQDIPAPATVEVRPFPIPAGAPDLDDRGGDLVLVAGGTRVLLARRVGAGWRAALEAARAQVVAGIPGARLIHFGLHAEGS